MCNDNEGIEVWTPFVIVWHTACLCLEVEEVESVETDGRTDARDFREKSSASCRVIFLCLSLVSPLLPSFLPMRRNEHTPDERMSEWTSERATYCDRKHANCFLLKQSWRARERRASEQESSSKTADPSGTIDSSRQEMKEARGREREGGGGQGRPTIYGVRRGSALGPLVRNVSIIWVMIWTCTPPFQASFSLLALR